MTISDVPRMSSGELAGMTKDGAVPTDIMLTEDRRFAAHLLTGVTDPFFARVEVTNRNVFLGSRFLDAVEQHLLNAPDRLALVSVVDRTGKPVALFPFIRRRKFGVVVLEGLDLGITDYFAPAFFHAEPLSPKETAVLWRTAIKAVPGIHAVSFKKMPRLLQGRPNALTGADFLKPMGASATTLSLRHQDGSPLDVDKISVAREVRRKSKKLAQLGPVTFSEAKTNDEVDAAMETLVGFRRARFSDLGRRDAMLDSRIVSFYRSLADRSADNPPARLLTLRTGERPVAVVYGFACDDVFTLIAPAITDCKETQSGSPGLVAIYNTLRWCFEEGYRVFDLSVGSLSYKSRFDAETFELFEHQQALSPLGLPVVLEAALRRRLRRLALNRPALHDHLERLARLGQRIGLGRD
jgi:CelD/BcsL family acetyltransferase involved in cellulose biosynthesis